MQTISLHNSSVNIFLSSKKTKNGDFDIEIHTVRGYNYRYILFWSFICAYV